MVIVRIFIWTATIAGPILKQTTVFYNQANSASFSFIPCKQS